MVHENINRIEFARTCCVDSLVMFRAQGSLDGPIQRLYGRCQSPQRWFGNPARRYADAADPSFAERDSSGWLSDSARRALVDSGLGQI